MSDESFEKFISTNPSKLEDVETVERAIGRSLPADYRSFLLSRGGGEGFLGRRYLVLWNADQILPYNIEYEANKYAPGLLLFGTDGGGEGFAFDVRNSQNNIVIVPFIGMSLKDAKNIASSFTEFVARLCQPDTKLF